MSRNKYASIQHTGPDRYTCVIPQEAKSKSSQFSLVSVVFKIQLTRRPTKAQFTKINTTFIIENPLLTKVMDIISKLLLITLSQSTVVAKRIRTSLLNPLKT